VKPSDRPAISLSELDSDRFGVRTARAAEVSSSQVPALLEFCREHRVELLIARCGGADDAAARALSLAGLTLVEAQLIYRSPLRPGQHAGLVREATPGDEAAVAEIARAGFENYGGHYHADPRLPRNACRDLYVDWAIRGIRREAADSAYVAELDGRVAAFGLFTCDDDEVTFALSSVAPWARGRGLYREVLERGMTWGVERGARSVVGVVAHGTVGAHRNLIAAGLRPEGSVSTFHGWRETMAV
jgi:hypothetical protein